MLKQRKLLVFLILLISILLVSGCKDVSSSSGNKTNKETKIEPVEAKIHNEINFCFEGNNVELSKPVYNEKNRIFVPLNDLVKNIGGKTTREAGHTNINFNNKNIVVDENESKYWYAENPSESFNLKKKITLNNNLVYVSLFDFSNMLDLKTRWNIENKMVYLFCNREQRVSHGRNANASKLALIRLEDIAAAQRYETAESLEKLRIVGDYLYSEGIPFHIAWVPRYIDKAKNIDNDPSKTYNMYNADFVYTMDYLNRDNGLIGLHGYTHQFNDEISIDGFEFSRRYNTDEKSIRDRLQLAINAAKELDFDYAFFESPHYAATDYQHRIMEEYFDYIYDPCSRKKGYNNKTIYVPTPLNYVDGKEDLKNMLNKIANLRGDTLGSFFYHPSIDFEFIKVNSEITEYPSYEYDSNSVLHQIVKSFFDKGYKFISIRELT